MTVLGTMTRYVQKTVASVTGRNEAKERSDGANDLNLLVRLRQQKCRGAVVKEAEEEEAGGLKLVLLRTIAAIAADALQPSILHR